MTGQADLLEFSDFVWQRLWTRLRGLTDDEYAWRPVPENPDLGLTWRLAHLTSLLREERNGPWLGQPAPPPARDPNPAATAAGALAGLEEAYGHWRAILAALPDAELGAVMGRRAGPYAASTRRSYVHHVLDEFIHHGAEAALLRDLWAGLVGGPG